MKRGWCSCLAVLACIGLVPSVAMAAPGDWQVVVIGQPGFRAEGAFADAYHASQALTVGGLGTVKMLRDAPLPSVTSAVSALRGAERVIIHYAGPLGAGGSAMALRDGNLDFATLLKDLTVGGTQQIALLIEDCAGHDAAAAGLIAPDIPDGTEVFVAASAGPGGRCPERPGRLTDLMAAAAETASGPRVLQDILSGLWTTSTLAEPLTLFDRPEPLAPASSAAPVVSVVSNDVVSLSPVITPVSVGTSITRVEPAVLSESDNRDTGAPREAVVIFSAPATSQIAALPQAAGLPEPSIIVGIIDGATSALFDQVDEPGDVSSNEVAYDNLEARRSLRTQDPDLFESLVAGGAFDPPEPLLATALQSELARMGCYNAGIDGIWGGGSRASVERYFAEIAGSSAETLEPTVGLFRQIIRRDDVVCPATAPVAAAAPQRTNTPATTNTSRATQQQVPPRQTPAPAPQAAPAPQRTIQSGTNLGVFR